MMIAVNIHQINLHSFYPSPMVVYFLMESGTGCILLIKAIFAFMAYLCSHRC